MKFKRPICLLLAFFLLVSNMGLAFNVRYCGNEIASVTLKTPVQDQNLEKDCCGVVEKKSHCCKDKEVNFQKKTDDLIQKIVSFHADFTFSIEEWNPSVFSFVSNFKNCQFTSYYCDANAPPFFKLYHQYIFYA
ncbi:HYC_CC_PP family protein [Flavobacterium sp. ZB4P13]|uniref:HYC_CC_PP family protein n=1 Tax=Flavobacterium sp. ZB4P13 TaxID=3401728 RepID=UPI003AB0D4E1